MGLPKYLMTPERQALRADRLRAPQALKSMGLPALISRIRLGSLHRDIDAAYERYYSLCARMDAWEAENPEVARLMPWYEAREAWKAAGRPEPEWWEVLRQWEMRQTFETLLGWRPDDPNHRQKARERQREFNRKVDERKRADPEFRLKLLEKQLAYGARKAAGLTKPRPRA